VTSFIISRVINTGLCFARSQVTLNRVSLLQKLQMLCWKEYIHAQWGIFFFSEVATNYVTCRSYY